MIGANFPDIDVIAVPLGDSLTWRRGITHGFLALTILLYLVGRELVLKPSPVVREEDWRRER